MNTREVAVGAIRLMEEQGIPRDNIAVLAHPYHMPRADATMQAVLPPGMEAVIPDGLDSTNIQWDPNSTPTQTWTRDPQAWRGREPWVIAYFALRGWLDLAYAAGPPLETV